MTVTIQQPSSASDSPASKALRAGDVVATYVVRGDNIAKVADAIAIGQSIGNPNIRLDRETREMWDRFGCEVRDTRLQDDGSAELDIGFPAGNFTPRSLLHLLTCIMGGQMDIDIIKACRLVKLDIPDEILGQYKGPHNGIEGIRDYLGAHGRPLIGGIVKPKTGITPDQLVDICLQMADGGVDFIKEDEILGIFPFCPLQERVEKVMRALEPYKVIFAPALTSTLGEVEGHLDMLNDMKCPGFHYNVWAGPDAFRYLADRNGMFAFYQKSGDGVFTTGPFSIDFTVWCQIIRLAGADFTHAGMMGGYLDEDEGVMIRRLGVLRDANAVGHKGVMPSLSCGAVPGVVPVLAEKLGNDIMVSSGGAIHGHPGGTWAGAKSFRDAAEGRSSPELDVALEKWGSAF